MIRQGTSGDAPALARLKLETFRQTFLEDFAVPYPPADLVRFETESYAVPKIEAELADPAQKAWVVEAEDGRLVGYCRCGPCKLPHPDVREGDPELYQLYLLREGQGLGLGGRLLRVALDTLGAARPIWLGVWSGNARAQALYGRHGFRPVGTYGFPVGDWIDDEIILRRD